jgi:hypothetical protein
MFNIMYYLNFLTTTFSEVLMRNTFRFMVLITVVLTIACMGAASADTGLPAQPEVQGLRTATSANVIGTVTETDSGAWSVNAYGVPLSGNDPIIAQYPDWATNFWPSYSDFLNNWNTNDLVYFPGLTVDDLLNAGIAEYGDAYGIQELKTWMQNQGSPLTPPLQSEEVQYTAGYNDQYSGVSGQQIITKSVALSTANTIVDQSNIEANTNIQYIAVDTGRATRTEDLLLDGASNSTNGQNSIVCPFGAPSPSVFPSFCNIEQAGSAFDTTLTSTVTSADTRFVGTDGTVPVVLNYHINAEGLVAGNQSSPMIGSVSAYLKVHIQEARNVSKGITGPAEFRGPYTINPQKSEDLAYSETSAASGLISGFGKSMSYSSQASAVPAPAIPNNFFN